MAVRREPDLRALSASFPRSEVAAFRAAESSSGRWRDWTMMAAVAFVVIGVLVGGIPLVGAVFLVADGQGEPAAFVFPLFVAAAVVGGVFLARGLRWRMWERRLRLTCFARDNGLAYDEPGDQVDYPGAAFGVGSARSRGTSFRSVDGPFVEFGDYQWSTGSGKNRRTHRIGFAAMRLERALPHMVLDARGNNGFFGSGVIPFPFDRDQVLSLEGDFDEHFTLFCPSDYERDALYVFTPDVMALLIDSSSLLDVEIVDDWVFFYSTTPFDFDEPATWRRLFGVHDSIVAKLRRVAGRYRDERVAGQDPLRDGPSAYNPAPLAPSAFAPAPDGVPPSSSPQPRRFVVGEGGRRLRSGTSWIGILAIVLIAGFWIVTQFLR